MKNIQIPYELFVLLLHYHLLDDTGNSEKIQKGLEKKLAALAKHDLYGKSKTALTEEEREKARQEYLDRQGVPERFRW
jgi:hypothetical protein